MFLQPSRERPGMMVGSVVDDDDHFLASGSAPQKRLEEGPETLSLTHFVEVRVHFTPSQVVGAKQGDRLARRSVEDHWLGLLRRHPHRPTTSLLPNLTF